MVPPVRYRDAGVDIDAGEEAVRRIRSHVRSTFNDQVVSDVGSFAGLMRIPGGDPDRWLVSSIDGVGTKIKVAVALERYDTVGEDLVNHCTGDIGVHGADPLFFLDYVAFGTLDPAVVEAVVSGLARGCRANGCALIGGETAEMPGIYTPPDFDLAGCVVGMVDRQHYVDGSTLEPGDVFVGVRSTGLHTNGYSLARKVLFDANPVDPQAKVPGTQITVGDALLAVHRSYLPELRSLRGRMRGAAHITGGGIPGNLARILPQGIGAEIHVDRWSPLPIFKLIADRGSVPTDDLLRTFNLGVGLIAALPADAAQAWVAEAPGDRLLLGHAVSGEGVTLHGELQW